MTMVPLLQISCREFKAGVTWCEWLKIRIEKDQMKFLFENHRVSYKIMQRSVWK